MLLTWNNTLQYLSGIYSNTVKRENDSSNNSFRIHNTNSYFKYLYHFQLISKTLFLSPIFILFIFKS